MFRISRSAPDDMSFHLYKKISCHVDFPSFNIKSFATTHPQHHAVHVKNFVCFSKVIDDVRLSAVVDSQIRLPNLIRRFIMLSMK